MNPSGLGKRDTVRLPEYQKKLLEQTQLANRPFLSYAAKALEMR
jgi:hypothetical protein